MPSWNDYLGPDVPMDAQRLAEAQTREGFPGLAPLPPVPQPPTAMSPEELLASRPLAERFAVVLGGIASALQGKEDPYLRYYQDQAAQQLQAAMERYRGETGERQLAVQQRGATQRSREQLTQEAGLAAQRERGETTRHRERVELEKWKIKEEEFYKRAELELNRLKIFSDVRLAEANVNLRNSETTMNEFVSKNRERYANDPQAMRIMIGIQDKIKTMTPLEALTFNQIKQGLDSKDPSVSKEMGALLKMQIAGGVQNMLAGHLLAKGEEPEKVFNMLLKSDPALFRALSEAMESYNLAVGKEAKAAQWSIVEAIAKRLELEVQSPTTDLRKLFEKLFEKSMDKALKKGLGKPSGHTPLK